MSSPINLQESRRIADLHPFPLQERINGPLNEKTLADLAADIKQRGLQHPVEILPAGMMLCGHHRLAACKRLGWIEIPVIVRHDLAKATLQELRLHSIQDNLQRNHHGPIAQARLIVALDEEMAAEDEIKGRHRDQRARTLLKTSGINISGKTLERRVKLLNLPIALQQLVDDGTISQSLALRLANKPKKTRDAISTAVLESEDPKKLLGEMIAQTGRDKAKPDVLDKLAMQMIALCDRVHQLNDLQREELFDRVVSTGVNEHAFDRLKRLIIGDVDPTVATA